MQGITTSGATAATQSQAASHSRRPGTAGHPGKHLGQLKHQPDQPASSNLPLVQQQLSALNGSGTRSQSGSSQFTAQQNDLFYAMALDALRSTGNNVSDQLDFTGKLNAITTAI
ncbi:MAG TPA: hypothetical protein PLB10_13800 [Thiolinea sp.]|nr:hypothetical protein [Thiolinea sp.]